MNRALLIGTIMILLLPQLSWGQIPQTMSYQGVVTDASGVAVDGNVDLTFRLWGAATAGTQLWTETQAGVAVNNGIINVILGSVNPLNIPFDKQYWLGVTVGTDPELTPRVQLTSSPYSLSTQSGGGGNSLDAADGDPTDALFVDNAGNVGIGMTQPKSRLHVQGNYGIRNTGNPPAIRLEDTGGNPDENFQIAVRNGEFRIETNIDAFNAAKAKVTRRTPLEQKSIMTKAETFMIVDVRRKDPA